MKSFTLIETLVAIFIFALMSAALAAFLVLGYRTNNFTWQESMAINEARKGMEIMAKEIRGAKEGEDGSYPIEKAGDKEFIFYSDIDGDGKTERVRYFLGITNSGSQTKECVSFQAGGSCSVDFSNFSQGTLTSAQVKVSVEGDLGASNEYAEIFADGVKLGNLCQSGCTDCAGSWQGIVSYDVTSQASDSAIQFLADASPRVDPSCNWVDQNHSIKANFEFSFNEDLPGFAHEFRKGVVEPVVGANSEVSYPLDQEKITVISSYVRNVPPIFEYFDKDGNKIASYPAALKDAKLMKLYLVVNVNPMRSPQDFGLESWVQMRNLKEE